MTSTFGLNEKKIGNLLHLMVFTAVLSVTLLTVFHPKVRSKVRSLTEIKGRQILSVASGDLFSNGTSIKVVKLLTKSSIVIEVYGALEPSQNRKLIHSFSIDDPHDGYFHFNNAATNLVLDDIDNDQTIEIIAPTFDSNLVAHLNIYKFDKTLEKFIPFTPPSKKVSH